MTDTTTTAQSLCLVARQWLESRCATLPEHLINELAGIATDNTLPGPVRREAELILEEAREL